MKIRRRAKRKISVDCRFNSKLDIGIGIGILTLARLFAP